MSPYPTKCQCCQRSILSRRDHGDHILQHQNDLGLLVQSLVQNSDQDREPCDDAIVSKPCAVNNSLQNQEPETRKRRRSPHDQESGPEAKRVRPKHIPCPQCSRKFTQLSDMERHRFTRMVLDLCDLTSLVAKLSRTDYKWHLACNDCQLQHPNASGYAQHLCKGQTPDRGVIRSRQEFVEKTLGISIMAERKQLAQVKKVKPPAPSMQHISEGLWQSTACLDILDFDEDGELVLEE
ncbi:hypothetical protein FALCPG4_014848 [Fusarium falciforme]